MKILYASALESNAGWGAEVSLSRELVNAGMAVHNIDYRMNRNRLYKQFRTAGDFDLFFLQRGDYFPIGIIRTIRRPRIFYFSELVAVRNDADDLFRGQVFDHYLVRSERCRYILDKRGWVPLQKTSILLSAFDPSVYFATSSVKDIDILFIGTLTPRRKAILSLLTAMFNITVISAFGREASLAFNRAKIVVNIHATDEIDTETRIFEALGAGAFIITEKLGAESPFVNSQDLIEVDTISDLIDKLRYYLNSSEAREIIAIRGHVKALEWHTYQARSKQLLQVFKHFAPGHSIKDPLHPLLITTFGMQERLKVLVKHSKGVVRSVIGR